ncbi:hypothetical protein PINS_up022232 [Pythium insidiosum]|nr:hypothetical protein PINS_up022232 [Pythium insidiosum]
MRRVVERAAEMSSSESASGSTRCRTMRAYRRSNGGSRPLEPIARRIIYAHVGR